MAFNNHRHKQNEYPLSADEISSWTSIPGNSEKTHNLWVAEPSPFTYFSDQTSAQQNKHQLSQEFLYPPYPIQ